MKIDITPDIIRRIQTALSGRGVHEVVLKIEEGQLSVIAVTRQKVDETPRTRACNPHPDTDIRGIRRFPCDTAHTGFPR